MDQYESMLRKVGAFFIGRTVYIVGQFLFKDLSSVPGRGSRLEYNFSTSEISGYTWSLSGFSKDQPTYDTLQVNASIDDVVKVFESFLGNEVIKVEYKS